MARIIEGTPYEVESDTVACAGTYTFDINPDDVLYAVEYDCNVWDWFESAEGTLNSHGVVTWECPECGYLNEFEIGG